MQKNSIQRALFHGHNTLPFKYARNIFVSKLIDVKLSVENSTIVSVRLQSAQQIAF